MKHALYHLQDFVVLFCVFDSDIVTRSTVGPSVLSPSVLTSQRIKELWTSFDRKNTLKLETIKLEGVVAGVPL